MVEVDKIFQIDSAVGLKQVRIIVTKTPKWLDKIAQRVTCTPDIADIQSLATGVVAPVIAAFLDDSSITINIYLFRQLDRELDSMKRFSVALDEDMSFRRQREGIVDGPAYTIKTLSDYIDEGMEDEFLWQELQYWRGENRRRLTEVEVEDVSEIDEMVFGMFVGFPSYSANHPASRSTLSGVVAPIP
jgi:hypothetical protein